MYEYVDESQFTAMDDWEDVLTNDLYDIEENIETFLQSLSEQELANTMSLSKEQISEQSGIIDNSNVAAGGSNMELNDVAPSVSAILETQSQSNDDSTANEPVVNEDSGILESSKSQNACDSPIVTISYHPKHSTPE